MNSQIVSDMRLGQLVRAELLRLAQLEEQRALEAAAKVAYWEPCPPVVLGHRAAARGA